MTKATDLIAAERGRQVTEEGYTAEHDAGHTSELVLAANAYVAAAFDELAHPGEPSTVLESGAVMWPWAPEFWKPTGDTVRDLVKAGALIAAAIDSLIPETHVPAEGNR